MDIFNRCETRWIYLLGLASGLLAGVPTSLFALPFNPPVWVAGEVVSDPSSAYNSADLFAERVPDAGTLHVVWAAHDAQGRTVLRHRSEQAAGTSVFTDPRDFAPAADGVELREPSVCVDMTRRVHFAWIRIDETGSSLRYRSLRNGTFTAEEEIFRPPVPAGRLWHPTVRAVPLDRDDRTATPIVVVQFQDPADPPEVSSLAMRHKPLGAETWEVTPLPVPLPAPVPPLGPFHVLAYQFDIVSSVGPERRPQGAVLLRCMPVYGNSNDQFYRTLFINQGAALGGDWAITQTDLSYNTPGDDFLVVQSVGSGMSDLVAHFVHLDTGGGLRQAHYTQLSPLPGGSQGLETRTMGFESQSIGGLAILPDDGESYRFQRPLTMVSLVGGLPAVAQNTGGLSEDFRILPTLRRMTSFAPATALAVEGEIVKTGMPKVAFVVHKTVPRARVLVTTTNNLLLYNEEGLDRPVVGPTPTPAPTQTPAPTATPSMPPDERVLRGLVGSGANPTTMEFLEGDANGDTLWDCSDVVRMKLENK